MIYLLDINSTGLNSILTVFSIICTICTGIFAYRAKKIKDDLLEKQNSFKLVSYKDRIHKQYLDFSAKAKMKDWNQGGKSNELLTNLDTELRNFNQFGGKISLKEQKELKSNINKALNEIDSLINGMTQHPTNLLTFLDRIDAELNIICNNLMSK